MTEAEGGEKVEEELEAITMTKREDGGYDGVFPEVSEMSPEAFRFTPEIDMVLEFRASNGVARYRIEGFNGRANLKLRREDVDPMDGEGV